MLVPQILKQRFILSFPSRDAEFQRSLEHSLKIIAWITRSYARATLAVSQTPVSCLSRLHIVRHNRCRRQLTRNALINPKKRCVVFETQPLWRKCASEASFTVNGQPMRVKQLYYTQDGTVLFLLIGHLFIPRCKPLFESMQYYCKDLC